ncbi:MAG: ROK family protein, partial [Dehalococcoidales bacterium]|nr:ROK family protein [Dehalococcoidales bacterium]
LGVGRGVSNLIYLTLGTGIGGAIIIDDKLYIGASGSAGELGHMTIDINGPRCNCGNIGCWEAMASGTAIAREAVARIGCGEPSALTDMVEGKLEDITTEKVARAARQGDRLSQEVVHNAAVYLGIGMVNLVNIFNPEMIIVGGGMAPMGDQMLNPARQLVRERAFPISARAVRIVPTKLGNDAGMLGAASFAFQQSDKE